MGPELTPFARPADLPSSKCWQVAWLRQMEIAMSPEAYYRDTPIVEHEGGSFRSGYGWRAQSLERAEAQRVYVRGCCVRSVSDNPIDWC